LGETYLTTPSTAFSDILQATQPEEPAPALENPVEQPTFEPEAPPTSDAGLTTAAPTENQPSPRSSMPATKQAPSENIAHVTG
jgi:hypothetical protein